MRYSIKYQILSQSTTTETISERAFQPLSECTTVKIISVAFQSSQLFCFVLKSGWSEVSFIRFTVSKKWATHQQRWPRNKRGKWIVLPCSWWTSHTCRQSWAGRSSWTAAALMPRRSSSAPGRGAASGKVAPPQPSAQTAHALRTPASQRWLSESILRNNHLYFPFE